MAYDTPLHAVALLATKTRSGPDNLFFTHLSILHMNSSIRAIDKESVHRICSGQVVLDMATAVKELLENSLDAGATSIVVKFKQNGLESITVTDNGCGITDENLETLALKHYTSKLSSFNDLEQVRSFGFRGEALSSLCALANVTVTTSTGNKPVGVMVEYNADGIIKSKTPTSMTKGTIVKISNLFEGMPVRRNEFVKNIKREYNKCIGLIQAYALIVTNTRISCVSQTDKKPPATYIATNGNDSVRSNIINVFGAKSMVDIIDFDLVVIKAAPSKGENKEDDEDDVGDIVLKGHISSPSFGKGRSSADRQYFFINGRPCVQPKIARVINEVYHSFNTNQSPFLVANLILPTSFYDVNVSPDKRTIFLHNERTIVEELRIKLTELFEPSRSTFAVSEARQLIKKPDLASRLKASTVDTAASQDDDDDDGNDSTDRPTVRSTATRSRVVTVSLSSLSLSSSAAGPETQSTTAPRLLQTSLSDRFSAKQDQEKKRKRTARDNFSDSEGEHANGQGSTEIGDSKEPEIVLWTEGGSSPSEDEGRGQGLVEMVSKRVDSALDSSSMESALNVMEGYDPLDDRVIETEEVMSDSEDDATRIEQKAPKLQRVVVLDSEVHNDGDREWIEVNFDLADQKKRRAFRMKVVRESREQERERRSLLKEQAKRKLELAHSHSAGSNVQASEEDSSMAGVRQSRRLRHSKLSDASFANTDDAKAQKSLSRVISKGDFARMKILGQFNKAFIVARLDKFSTEEQDITEDDCPSKAKKGSLISSDIFVIDQHASDEKYNFETLQAKTVFSTQRLFQPKKLYLTAQEEITVVDHMKMLNKNGFYLDYDPEAAVSHRLKLVTLPVSERVVFDVQDFEELVFLLSQQTAASIGGTDDSSDSEPRSHTKVDSSGTLSEKMIRCSKVRSLFASRACRRSVMIGHVLNHGQMKRIVRHMGEIDQPWNCPHGRPTMRHLLDLTELAQQEQHGRWSQGREDEDDVEEGGLGEVGPLQEQSSTFDPIALKRPTRHRGSLFKQFMAIPNTHVSL